MDGVGGDADLDAGDFQLGKPLHDARHDLIVLPGDQRVVQVGDDGRDPARLKRFGFQFFNRFDDLTGVQSIPKS